MSDRDTLRAAFDKMKPELVVPRWVFTSIIEPCASIVGDLHVKNLQAREALNSVNSRSTKPELQAAIKAAKEALG